MAGIKLKGKGDTGVTMISNLFIDRYMVSASGEFVKVYLYLLRKLTAGDGDFSLSAAADFFEHTEKDMVRALNYWQKEGLLRLERDSGGGLTVIELMDIKEPENGVLSEASGSGAGTAGPAGQKAAPLQPEAGQADNRKKMTAYPGSSSYTKDMTGLKNDDDFTQLLYITQKYLERPLNYTDTKILAYLYDDLKCSLELLEYLIEECVSARHTSLHYIEKVAIDWHKNDIKTIEDARTYSSFQRKECYEVMRALGLKGGNLATVEKRLVYKWLYELNFSMTIILEACNRTVLKTTDGRFAYADAILVRWHEQGVKRKEDIEALDIKYKNAKKDNSRSPKGSKPASNNKFHNFEQRGYDYDALLKNSQ